MKKLMPSLLGLVTAIAPVATVVACSLSSSGATLPTATDPETYDNEKETLAENVFKAIGATDADLDGEFSKVASKTFTIYGTKFTLSDVVSTTFKNAVHSSFDIADIVENTEVSFGKANNSYYFIYSTKINDDITVIPVPIAKEYQDGFFEDILRAVSSYYDEVIPLKEVNRQIKFINDQFASQIINIPQLSTIPSGILSSTNAIYQFYTDEIFISDGSGRKSFVFDVYDSNNALEKEVKLTFKAINNTTNIATFDVSVKSAITGATVITSSQTNIQATVENTLGTNFVFYDTQGAWPISLDNDISTISAITANSSRFVRLLNKNKQIGKLELTKAAIDPILANLNRPLELKTEPTLDGNGLITSMELQIKS